MCFYMRSDDLWLDILIWISKWIFIEIIVNSQYLEHNKYTINVYGMSQTLVLNYHENKLKNNHSIFLIWDFQTNVSSFRNGYCRDTDILLLQYAVITIAIMFRVPAMCHMLYIF